MATTKSNSKHFTEGNARISLPVLAFCAYVDVIKIEKHWHFSSVWARSDYLTFRPMRAWNSATTGSNLKLSYMRTQYFLFLTQTALIVTRRVHDDVGGCTSFKYGFRKWSPRVLLYSSAWWPSPTTANIFDVISRPERPSVSLEVSRLFAGILHSPLTLQASRSAPSCLSNRENSTQNLWV